MSEIECSYCGCESTADNPVDPNVGMCGRCYGFMRKHGEPTPEQPADPPAATSPEPAQATEKQAVVVSEHITIDRIVSSLKKAGIKGFGGSVSNKEFECPKKHEHNAGGKGNDARGFQVGNNTHGAWIKCSHSVCGHARMNTRDWLTELLKLHPKAFDWYAPIKAARDKDKAAKRSRGNRSSQKDAKDDPCLPPSNCEPAIQAILQAMQIKTYKDRRTGDLYLEFAHGSPLASQLPDEAANYKVPIDDELLTHTWAWASQHIVLMPPGDGEDKPQWTIDHEDLSDDAPQPIKRWKLGQEALLNLLHAFPTHHFNPAVDYFERCSAALPADSPPAIPDILTSIWDEMQAAVMGDNVFTAEEADFLIKEGERQLLIGMVAKQVEPGSKTRVSVVLTGNQNAGKRTFFTEIVPTYRDMGIWSADLTARPYKEIITLDKSDKEIGEAMVGMWLVLFPEMAGAHDKNRLDQIKALTTATHDTFRPAYGRHSVTYPRTCVLAGKTNLEASAIPHDQTGNTRWLALNIGNKSNDPATLLNPDSRARIYGIAYRMWKEGMRPNYPRNRQPLLDRLANRHSPGDNSFDTFCETIDAMDSNDEIKASALRAIINDNKMKVNNATISNWMHKLGYSPTRVRSGKERYRVWVKPNAKPSEAI